MFMWFWLSTLNHFHLTTVQKILKLFKKFKIPYTLLNNTILEKHYPETTQSEKVIFHSNHN